MSRKKWNRLTKKGKDDLVDKITALQLKLTDIEDNWEKIYDLEESINDNIKSLFECDAECMSCTVKDRAACLLNFRKANVFWLGKIKTYEVFFFDAVQYLGKFVQSLYSIITGEEAPEDSEEDDEKKKDLEKGDLPSMFA